MSASNDVRVVKVGNVSVGGGTLAVAAGPCVLDTFDEALAIAKTMKEYCAEFGFGYIFKASFDKANRTSIKSYRGPGIEKGLETLNPYRKTEAETMAFSEEMKADENKEVGVFVNAMKDGAYIKVKGVDFRKEGASKFSARVGTTHNGGVTMEVRLDSPQGDLLTTVNVPMTGGDDRWALVSSDVANVSGVHDLYFVCKGRKPGRLMYFDYWMFSQNK